MTRVWQTNMQVMEMIVEKQKDPPRPLLRYTWVQEPVRLEDPLGRVVPIPSEFSWGVRLTHPIHCH